MELLNFYPSLILGWLSVIISDSIYSIHITDWTVGM